MNLNIIEIGGTEYAVVPKKEYDKLRGHVPEGSVNALEYAKASIAADLKSARETAHLTQGQLAKNRQEPNDGEPSRKRSRAAAERLCGSSSEGLPLTEKLDAGPSKKDRADVRCSGRAEDSSILE